MHGKVDDTVQVVVQTTSAVYYSNKNSVLKCTQIYSKESTFSEILILEVTTSFSHSNYHKTT